jgi:hypothetical protein
MNAAAVMLLTEKCKTPFEGWKVALKWVMNLDDKAVARRMAREAVKHASLKLRRTTDI